MNDTCIRCGKEFPSWNGVYRSDGEGQSLGFHCGPCWAAVLSEIGGEDIGHVELKPVILHDFEGKPHEFHFRFHPVPRGLEAFELVDGAPGGYQFTVSSGVKGEELPSVVEPLLEKMCRALQQQHLEPCELMPGGLSIKNRTVRGRIDCDLEQDRLPIVVIDGKPIRWKRFGEMLMQFEGWQFRLEMVDRTDET